MCLCVSCGAFVVLVVLLVGVEGSMDSCGPGPESSSLLQRDHIRTHIRAVRMVVVVVFLWLWVFFVLFAPSVLVVVVVALVVIFFHFATAAVVGVFGLMAVVVVAFLC